jgi:hypothetical protein
MASSIEKLKENVYGDEYTREVTVGELECMIV